MNLWNKKTKTKCYKSVREWTKKKEREESEVIKLKKKQSAHYILKVLDNAAFWGSAREGALTYAHVHLMHDRFGRMNLPALLAL